MNRPVGEAPLLEADKEQVREIVARSGTSFAWGMRILERPRREAMHAIYAFCREVDDVADEPAPLEKKLEELALWREEVANLYAGRPSRPITRALQGPVRDYQLPQEEFLAVIDGMEMDARELMVAPDRETLTLYCRRVAGAVGMLSIHAFGATDKAARRIGIVLGEGLQLTNVLRDLGEDAERGRLYLPREGLEEAGIETREPLEVLKDPRLPEVCRPLAETAAQRFAETRWQLTQAEFPDRLKPCRLMMAMYEPLLARLRAEDFRDPWHPPRLGKAAKLWIALREGLLG